MMRAGSEAERLRQHRLIFERALRDGIDMAEARRRLVQERWAESERRLAARRGLCGTAAPSFQPEQEGERELAWWQK